MNKKSLRGSREDNTHDSTKSTPSKKQKSKSQRTSRDRKISIQHLSNSLYQNKHSQSLNKIVFFDQF